ncbi:uncharacterized protein EI97DRAFT_281992 [Westerdykella ornata]|uniref:Zn(2)-C6 fungal-type domain-containing protein n=1 Tax=Westerdykella ornata TaxID=318751 RepID=A0A6A6JN10_WESOR|nr:uncharacterized protein EI97DRAFT_281992 [Westerdykella ornata]KAF2278040.1 hypothetical protein EI97DRAFT_281992 [Westerdykella ornata]
MTVLGAATTNTTSADDSSSSAPPDPQPSTASTSSTPSISQVRANKRRCVSSACVPCRKRKSKCDGGTPVCATCTAVYKTECYYSWEQRGDLDAARRSTSTLKRDAASATATASASANGDGSGPADFLIKAIRSLPESEASELIHHIRKDPRLDVASLADTWKKTVTLPFIPASDRESLEGDLSLLLGKPSLTQTGESRHFGHTSSLGLVQEDENYTISRRPPAPCDYKNGTWTSVTQDVLFVEHLLDLYFQWSHAFYVIFSRECFYKDFRSGRQKYCSPLLVNALLAYGCHFSDDPRARTEPSNPRTAGDHFFAEARRLLYEDESPSLTTAQALCVMAMREPSAGRDSSGFMYIGRCMRMCVELGMHLNTTSSPSLGLTPSEIEVRKVTFWGCFIVDTVWTLCIGRVAQLPKAAITVDKPIMEEATYSAQSGYSIAPPHVTSRLFLQEFATFAELVSDNNFMFYAPKERITSRRLLNMYERYQKWYKELPAPLRLPDRPDARPLAHVIVLHMLYYTVILHLFRPMLKVDLVGSDIRPRDMCIEMANKVSELLRAYRQHYDMRACQLVFTHILLSISIVHLLYSQNHTNANNLVDSLRALEDLSVCHYFGARSFKIVHSLAKTWNLPWPEALKLSKLVPKEDVPVDSPPIQSLFHVRPTPRSEEVSSNGYVEVPSQNPMARRGSLSMFANGNPYAGQSGVPSSLPTAESFTSPQQQTGHPSSRLVPIAPNLTAPSLGPASPTQHTDNLFWTPAPNFAAPIFPRDYATGPMDLNSMLGPADEWDRYGRDGFKMSEGWPVQEQTMAYGPVGVNLGMQPNLNSGMNLHLNAIQETGASGSASTPTPGSTHPNYTSANPAHEPNAAPVGPGFQTW